MERSREIQRRHIDREAHVYVRVSTPSQAEKSEGSISHQEGLGDVAIEYGWTEHRIRIIRELGVSGTSTHRRPLFEQLREDIRADKVGAVFCSDLSRLARNDAELMSLLGDLATYDVLLVIDRRVHDLSDDGELFTKKIESLIGSVENKRRARMMHHGRVSKVRDGKAVTPPARGYVGDGNGGWDLDPDPLVQDSIRAIFSTFQAKRTLPKTVKALRDAGIGLPRRRKHRVWFTPPTVPTLAYVLHNPAYTGQYRYPQRKMDGRLGYSPGGFKRVRRARMEEQQVIADHHVAYISQADWDEVQRILSTNKIQATNPAPADGAAYLQGIVRCTHHGEHLMRARYPRRREDGSWWHGYQCLGDYLDTGVDQCGVVSGPRLDAVVLEEFFRRVDRPRIEAVRGAWQHAKRGEAAAARRRRIELEHARREAEDIEARVLAVDPSNELVAHRLQTVWQEKLRNLKQLESGSAQTTTDERFTEERWAEVVDLCGRVREIFGAATTENRDRKELIRMLVDRVLVERSLERVRVRIIWADGGAESSLEIKLTPVAQRRMLELDDAGVPHDAIAAQLNREGYRTRRDSPFSANTVSANLRTLRRQAEKSREVNDHAQRLSPS